MELLSRGVSLPFFGYLVWSLTLSSGTVIESPSMQPYFINTDQLEVNSTTGKTAYLRCRVRHLGSNTVVWLRERDLHILTYDVYTYTSEEQFESFHAVDSDEWTLMIRHPQVRDSGTYACQVSSEPYISQYFQLNIFVPRTKILGSTEQYFTVGSGINLTCVVMETIKLSEGVFWFKGEDVINNAVNEDTSVVTDRSRGVSQLIIMNAQVYDSGNYTCSISSSDYDTVVVVVQDELKDEDNGVS